MSQSPVKVSTKIENKKKTVKRNTKMASNSEARKRREEAARSQCDHPEVGLIANDEGELNVIEFTFCPLCGEKL